MGKRVIFAPDGRKSRHLLINPPNDMKPMKHPGFKAVAKSISKKEGVSGKAAGAILASASRKASPAAKKANPALKKVAVKKMK